MRVPIIYPDEYGYIDIARYLARGGARPQAEYYPGFSLLLAPLWLATSAPLTVWRGALVINAAIAGLSGLVIWALCKRLVPDLSWRPRLAITVLICLYPAFLLDSNLALAECLFSLVFGVVVLIAAQALPGGRPRWWAALGLACGALSAVHPRGLAVVVAAVILAIVVLRPVRRRANQLAALALAGGLTLSLAVTRWLVTATRGTNIGGIAAYRPDNVIGKSLSAH